MKALAPLPAPLAAPALLVTLCAAGCTIVDPRERVAVDLAVPVVSDVDLSVTETFADPGLGGPSTAGSDDGADLGFVDVGAAVVGFGKLEAGGEEHRLWRFGARLGGGQVGDVDLWELSLGGRAYHPEVVGLAPYLSGAFVISWYDEGEAEINSDAQAGLRLGTGVEYDLTHSLYLFAGVDYTFVLDESRTLTTDFDVIEIDYEGWALRVGLGWLF